MTRTLTETFVSTASRMKVGDAEMRGLLICSLEPLPQGKLPNNATGCVSDDGEVGVIVENGTEEEAERLLIEREAQLREWLRREDEAEAVDQHREPSLDEQLDEAAERYIERRRSRTPEELAADVADFERRVGSVIADPEDGYEVENGLATIACPWCVEHISFARKVTIKSHGWKYVTLKWTCEQGHKYKARM